MIYYYFNKGINITRWIFFAGNALLTPLYSALRFYSSINSSLIIVSFSLILATGIIIILQKKWKNKKKFLTIISAITMLLFIAVNQATILLKGEDHDENIGVEQVD